MKNCFKKIIGAALLGSVVLSFAGCSLIGRKPLTEKELTEYAEDKFDNYEITRYVDGGDESVLYLHDELYDYDYEISSKVISKGGLDGSTGRGKTFITQSTWCDELSDAVEDLAEDELDDLAAKYDCEYVFRPLGVSFVDGEKSVLITIRFASDKDYGDVETITEDFAKVLQQYNYDHYLDNAYVQAYVVGVETFGQVRLSDMKWEYGNFSSAD